MKRERTKTPTGHESTHRKKQRAFLAAFAKTGNVTLAALAAKVVRRTVYKWRSEPTFEKAFLEAQEEASDYLEAEARRRAIDGIDEPVIWQGELMGQKIHYNDTPEKNHFIPLTVKKYSDTLLIFLMKGARPEKYRDNHRHELATRPGQPLQIDAQVRGIDRRKLILLSQNPEAEELTMKLVELMALQHAKDVTDTGV